MKEEPLDYFLRMLIENKLKFSDLLSIYVSYLELKKEESSAKETEAIFLLSMWHNQKLNGGTKKQLVDRTVKLIKESKIFPEGVY